MVVLSRAMADLFQAKAVLGRAKERQFGPKVALFGPKHGLDAFMTDFPCTLAALGPKKAQKHMPGDFIPPAKGAYRAWLLNLKTQIPTQGPLFSLAAGEVTATVTITSAQIALEDAVVAAESALKSARDAQATGRKANNALLRNKISGWKQMSLFTPAIAQELRVVTTASTFDPDTFKPEFKVKIVGGEIRLDWTKHGADGVHIYARLRGHATWTLLGTDISSPYIDGRPLAQANVPETREYMLRGLIADHEIGLDSDILNATWGGA